MIFHWLICKRVSSRWYMTYTQIFIYNHPSPYLHRRHHFEQVGRPNSYVAAHRNNSNQCMIGACCTVPKRGSTQVLLCLCPGVLWLWHFLYSVSPHPVSSLHIYTFVASRAFMVGAASQAGDGDSSRAPSLTSGLQGSVNVHRGALLLVPQ